MENTETKETGRRRSGGPLGAARRTLALPWRLLRAVGLGARHAHRLYHPENSKVGRTPEHKKLPMRRMQVTTRMDGVTLEAWVVPGTGPHTVVVCHGVERSKSSTLSHIALLHGAGYHVVAYDMRNHGESTGDRRLGRMARRYTSDLRDVLRQVAADPELGRGKLALLGFSFSAWPSLRVLTTPGAPPVCAVVADSGPLYDIGAGLANFASLRRGSLPAWVRGGPAFACYRHTFRLVALRMLALRRWPPDLTGVPTRLMFVAGAADPLVTEDQVRRVARSLPGAHLWVAPTAMHMNAIRFDRREYESQVLTFLAESFAGPDQQPTPRPTTEAHRA
ncbi:alpha/beta hydrolase [Streptomyces sp. NPDC059578]|uniref:alpha/beta hydrolase n=1 Tax=unclassified Streptomyces TaxID=2593676 RepID=UPI003646F8D8